MVCYYNNVGLCNSVEEYYNFTMTPGFHTPDWAKGAIFNQIYVDRFYNGDRSNDVEDNEYIYIGEGTSKVTDWNKYPAAMGVREFYGGDIAGVMQSPLKNDPHRSDKIWLPLPSPVCENPVS